jgi:hypothetical protein
VTSKYVVAGASKENIYHGIIDYVCVHQIHGASADGESFTTAVLVTGVINSKKRINSSCRKRKPKISI